MEHPPQPCYRNVQLLKMETLGSGSYGVVCKAMYGQRLCAAKLLHSIFFQSNDPGVVTTRIRFEQECRFLNDMKHSNIVEYLGTIHDPDTGFLVLLMELCDESLTHFLEQSQQPLAYHIEVDMCHDIAQALAYIHSKGIIHRDLSSNNVLLIAGKTKITDFGMSKILDTNRRMQTPMTMCPGTSVYMPPEALRDPPVYTKKIDCFAYGVLQIQIMTRQFPDPGPAMQVVEDSRSPTGTIIMPVLESIRRKSHIDLINPSHALLPMALSCLSYLEEDRPSAQEFCKQLATFKKTLPYIQGVKICELQHQLEDSNSCIHKLQQQLEDRDSCIQNLQQQLQAKDQQLHHTGSHKCRHTLQQELQDNQKHHYQMESTAQLTAEDAEISKLGEDMNDLQLQQEQTGGSDKDKSTQKATPPTARENPFFLHAECTGTVLGCGAYGEVKEFKLQDTKTIVAGKKFKINQCYRKPSKFCEMVITEFALLANASHPHIVKYLGMCMESTSKLPILLMERMTTSLHKYITDPGNCTLPLGKKISLLCQVSEGLVYLHSKQIIHRDLTATNILLNSSGIAKISDFGNARFVDPDPESLTACPGTHLYMPPEACETGPNYNTKLDMFSFGHLSLVTYVQIQPETILFPNFRDGCKLQPRSEVERRDQYIRMLYRLFENEKHHPLVQLTINCLDNNPQNRPSAETAQAQLTLSLSHYRSSTPDGMEDALASVDLNKSPPDWSQTSSSSGSDYTDIN